MQFLSLRGGAYRWFQSRGIERGIVDRAGVMLARRKVPGSTVEDDHCIAFVYKEGGKAVNAKYRSADKKFMQEKGARKVWYNLDSCDGRDVAVVCEGEMDALSCLQAGIGDWAAVLSVPDGAPAKLASDVPPREEDTKYSFLWNCEGTTARIQRWILAGDNDDPGKALMEELARRIGKEKCAIVDWPSINDVTLKDANEVLVQEGAQVLRECVENARPYPIAGLYRASEFWSEVKQVYLLGRPRGTPTGWRSLDKHMSVPEGAFIVVTGIPSAGKSEFVDSLCMKLAKEYDWRFAMCSMENRPGDEHIPKLIQKFTGKPFFQTDILAPRISQDELKLAMDWVEKRFLFISPTEEDTITIDWILERSQRAVNMFGIRAQVIDPYNEIFRDSKTENEAAYLSNMIAKVKRFNRRNRVTTIFVAHPTKLQRDRKGVVVTPTLYDISGGAHWFNKADIGIVIDREWNKTINAAGDEIMVRGNRTVVHVQKVRFNWIGKPGRVTLEYDEESCQYREPEV